MRTDVQNVPQISDWHDGFQAGSAMLGREGPGMKRLHGRFAARPLIGAAAMAPLLFAAIHVAAAEDPKRDDPKQVDRARLQGTWKMTDHVISGGSVDPKELSGSGQFWVIRGDRLTEYSKAPPPPRAPGQVADPGEGRRIITESTFELDSTKAPSTITLIYPGGVRHTCIYRIDGDALTICANSRKTPVPKEFDSPPKSSMVILTFVRSNERP